MKFDRFIENVKIPLRRNKYLFCIMRILYLPISGVIKLRSMLLVNFKVKQKLKELKQLKRNDNIERIYYFGLPIHKNLGDAAQRYCIQLWLKRFFPNVEVVTIETMVSYSPQIRKELKRIIVPQDIIIVQSGATFCNRHRDHEMHRFLLEKFKENRLLFLPNTVDLDDSKQMEITSSLFNNHKNAIFIARDPVSFRMVQEYFDNTRILLTPDIVTSLIGNVETAKTKKNILVCKRIDGEKIYSDKDVSYMINGLKTIGEVDITDTESDYNSSYIYDNLEYVIKDKINQFSNYKLIVTDRYHGMIFSLISNTPVIVFATKGHKVREGALWLKKDYPNGIWFCNTPEEVLECAKKIYGTNIQNMSLYKEKYFDTLSFKVLEMWSKS